MDFLRALSIRSRAGSWRTWLPCILASATATDAGVLAQASEAQDVLAWVSWSEGNASGPIELEAAQVASDPGMGRFVVFTQPGKSRVRFHFRIEEMPQNALIEIEHLSSSAEGVLAGGRSPVRVSVNDIVVCKGLDPGAHGFVRDRLHVMKYLRPGANHLEIGLEDAETAYWLRRIVVRGKASSPPGKRKPARRDPEEGTFPYAVCVSHETHEDQQWRAVADALVERHGGALVLHPSGDLSGVAALLGRIAPRAVAFVARPEECGRTFVLSIHRLTLTLTITARVETGLPRPVFAFLPFRVAASELPSDAAAVATDTFLLWHVPGILKMGEVQRLVLTVTPVGGS